jgi:tetratricopeptide (TPR) repeat protein
MFNISQEAKNNFNLGNNYFKQKNFAAAILAYQKALKICPEYIDAYNKLGIIYVFQGKFESAKNVYFKIIETETENYKIRYMSHNALGEIYSKLGNYKEAINEFKKAARSIKQRA